MTPAERVTAYAQAVVDGDVEACRFVRLACQRHLEDRKRETDEDFPYYFEDAAANKVLRFLELLPHVKGRWARNKERITLEDWQCFVVGVPFGWKKKANGNRRYWRTYIEVPRKNAKSTITAGLGLYMLAADDEHGAEVYSGAGSEKQAWEVFGPARTMAKRTPSLCDYYGIEVGARNLSILDKAAKFEPIIGKPGDGASPSFSITDEYHEHPSEEQYDTMITGMGSREQPIAWVITTAGSDTEGPCYDLRSEVVDALEGAIEADGLFGVIYTVDEGDDWSSEKALRKANPNMGVSVFEDYLKAQQRDAINNPRKQATFKTKHLNIWVTAAAPYFNLEKWNQLADPSLDPAQLAGEPVWIGLDLASKIDLTAKVQVFKRDGHYYAFCRSYLPEDRAGEPDKKHYQKWVEQGHLVATPGPRTDYDEIEADVVADSELHRIVELGFDPYNASQLIQHLMDHGVECVEVPQTVPHLSEPMKEVQALIEDGRIHHDGNPVFAWAIGNVTAQEDRNQNVFPRKERDDAKIDPAVALIIAMGRAMSSEPKKSRYETEDPVVF